MGKVGVVVFFLYVASAICLFHFWFLVFSVREQSYPEILNGAANTLGRLSLLFFPLSRRRNFKQAMTIVNSCWTDLPR